MIVLVIVNVKSVHSRKGTSPAETLILSQSLLRKIREDDITYKKNMFALLGKPGFEDLAKELNNRL